MAEYYVDPAATGANDGSSWTDAWTDLQSAADNVATGGDKVYCRNTQTLSASIDFDTNSGTVISPIEFIGVNASGVEDGTTFVLDGNSVVADGLVPAGVNYIYIRNFEIVNCTGSGIDPLSNTIGWNFKNVKCNNNGADGVESGNLMDDCNYIHCQFNNNTSDGIYLPSIYSDIVYCEFIGNGGLPINQTANAVMVFASIIHDNGNYIYMSGAGQRIIHSVVDGSGGYGVRLANYNETPIGNRITNNPSGGLWFSINNARSLLEDLNHFYNNGTDIITNNAFLLKNGNSNEGASDDGYEDITSDDFNLAEDAELRRTGIKVGPLG